MWTRNARRTLGVGVSFLALASACVFLWGSPDARSGYLLWLSATALTCASLGGLAAAIWFLRDRKRAEARATNALLALACLLASVGAGWLLDLIVRRLQAA